MFEQLIQGYYTIDIGKIKVKNMAGGVRVFRAGIKTRFKDGSMVKHQRLSCHTCLVLLKFFRIFPKKISYLAACHWNAGSFAVYRTPGAAPPADTSHMVSFLL